jgi:hypothetical protein
MAYHYQLNISHQDVFLLSVLSVRYMKSVIISSCSFPLTCMGLYFLLKEFM